MDKILGSSARRAGVLLHPTSLPSGVLGRDAERWMDFLAEAGFGVWQVLPLVIPDPTGSPYQSCSSFALNPALIDPAAAIPADRDECDLFVAEQAWWLDDFALFMALKSRFDQAPWFAWPEEYRNRHPEALARVRTEQKAVLEQVCVEQYQAHRAWQYLHQAANGAGIELFGDLPIFVAHDSADVWANPANFLLDDAGMPTYVAGVPPDYFSETGQRWGNPQYDWAYMEANGFDWWLNRVRRQFDLYDIVRLDHFRGLEAVWMIESDCETAIDGFWQKTPGDKLLGVLRAHYPGLPIVAEDLGVITDEVRALRRRFRLPGISVLQFAFDAFSDNPHKPANILPDNVVYTGTHDNDTTVGWFSTLDAGARDFVFEVLDREPTNDIAGALIEAALRSRAQLAIIPLQDLLRLDGTHRMNTPGTEENNWCWRFDWAQVPEGLARECRRLIADTGRLADESR